MNEQANGCKRERVANSTKEGNQCLSAPIPKSTLLSRSISCSCFPMLCASVNFESTPSSPSILPSGAFVQWHGVFVDCDASTGEECQSDKGKVAIKGNYGNRCQMSFSAAAKLFFIVAKEGQRVFGSHPVHGVDMPSIPRPD